MKPEDWESFGFEEVHEIVPGKIYEVWAASRNFRIWIRKRIYGGSTLPYDSTIDESIDFDRGLKVWTNAIHVPNRLLGQTAESALRDAARWLATYAGVDPVSRSRTYDAESRDIISYAAGQGGLLVLSYICSMSLVVHPSAYSGERFAEDEERGIIGSARMQVGLNFPYLEPEKGVNLTNGFQVITVPRRGEPPPDYREYYRFQRDGLFVLLRVSPDDINEDQQYRDSDRVIGLNTLTSTLTKMSLFAAALSKAYDVETTATMRVSGLANHRLVDDTAANLVLLPQLQVSHEDLVVGKFSGTPMEFGKARFTWAADVLVKCLRLLNFPGSHETMRNVVTHLQKELR